MLPVPRGQHVEPLRQDRKAWEGVLYRMVGRGALWTEDEINAMADFLAKRGPGKRPAAQKSIGREIL